MGPLTKRRHSTRRAGKRQAGQPKLKLLLNKAVGYVGTRARKAVKKQVKA